MIPSLSETAATPSLVTARWLMFLSAMAAIGLLVLRLFVARPLRSPPRAISRAFWISLAVALVATPVYVLMATAQFALRSMWSLGAVVPLMRTSAFGRAYLDLELLLALFAIAAGVALWVDRSDRSKRSIAELLATAGALLAAAGVLLIPGAGGHADQTSPRALAVSLDWLHLASGSLWVGGLLGLLVLWRSLPSAERLAGLAICVPRFSNVALGSVIVLLGSGTWASYLHLPTFSSLWQTSYGQAILVKVGLLFAAIVVASFNLLRTKPGLARPELAPRAAILLRRLVTVEVLLVATAVAVAAVLSSLAPPPKALAGFGNPSANVGPGVVTRSVSSNGYDLAIRVDPNKAAVPNNFKVTVTRGGTPVRGATVIATFTMLDMEMPALVVPTLRVDARRVPARRAGARDGGALGPHVPDRAAGPCAVLRRPRRPGERMRRVALLVALAAALTVAGSARADGDPASDYLLGQQVFFSIDGKVPSAKQQELSAIVAATNHAGYKVRVAVIWSPYDLGSVTSLWKKPQTYARFLGEELQFVYKQRLLIVMPNGFGVYWKGHDAAASYRTLAHVRIAKTPSGLVDAAGVAVQRLAASAGVHVKAPQAPPKHSHRTVTIILIAVAVLAVLVLLRLALRRPKAA